MQSSRSRVTRPLLLAASIGVLSACTVAPSLVPTRFQLSAADAGEPGVAPAIARVAPANPAPETTGIAPRPGDRTEIGQGPGALTVDVGDWTATRRLLATLSDVAKVVIKVEQLPFNSGLLSVEAVIDLAALQTGTRTHSFTGLPYGRYWVTLQALDATDVVIGSTERDVSVAGLAPVVVQLAVQLAPTIRTPPPSLGGSGGGTTPTPSPLGGLETRVSFVEGIELTQLPLLKQFDIPAHAQGLNAVPGGGAFVVGYDALEWYDAASGLTRSTAVSIATARRPLFDAQGVAHILSLDDEVVRVDAGGAILAPITVPSLTWDIAPAPNGDVWTLSSEGLARYAPDGTRKLLLAEATAGQRLLASPQDTVGIVGANFIEERDAAGGVIGEIRNSGNYYYYASLAYDPVAQAFLAVHANGSVQSFKSPGSLIHTLTGDNTQAIAIAPNGDTWAACVSAPDVQYFRRGSGSNTSNNTSPEGFHAVQIAPLPWVEPMTPNAIAIDDDGVLWLLDSGSGKLFAFDLPD